MRNKLLNKYCVAGIALVSFVLPSVASNHVAVAQAQNDATISETYSSRISFVPPADQGMPQRTRSGASRTESDGMCRNVVPILPETRAGLTGEEQFSLFVYVPEGSAEQAKLSFESVDGSEEFDAFVQLPPEGNIAQVVLPEAFPALKTGERYLWSLVLMCNGTLRPDSPVTTGEIKKVSSVSGATEASTLFEKAKIYGESGLWYDLITTLAELRAGEPGNTQLAENWASILTEVGLEDVADRPLMAQ